MDRDRNGKFEYQVNNYHKATNISSDTVMVNSQFLYFDKINILCNIFIFSMPIRFCFVYFSHALSLMILDNSQGN